MNAKPIPSMNNVEVNRFKSYVMSGGINECWLWSGSLSPQAYGQSKLRGLMYRSHRVAYRLHYRIDPKDLDVCHDCDNPPCCNPHHLFLGTQADNKADCVKKSRQARGERVSTAKLTVQDVINIRKLYANRAASIKKIARMYGRKFSTIQKITSKRSWKHVGGPITRWNKRSGFVTCKFSDDEVRKIRQLHKDGASRSSMSRMFECSRSTIRRIVTRESYANVI